MSGPKKANVRAQLNIASRSQKKCGELLSKSEDCAAIAIIDGVAKLHAGANEALSRLKQEVREVQDNLRHVLVDELEKLEKLVRMGEASLSSVSDGINNAMELLEKARADERQSWEEFGKAETEYVRAQAALDKAGQHYLKDEMRWAKEAARLFDESAKKLRDAAAARRKAETQATEASRKASETRSALEAARQGVQNLPELARSRIAAEEEFKRISDQKSLKIAQLLETGKAVLIGIGRLPHSKFVPGELDARQKEMNAAQRLAQAGKLDEAIIVSNEFVSAASKTAEKLAVAIQEYERRKAAAEHAVSLLEASLSGVDEAVVKNWAACPDACSDAHMAIAAARKEIIEEKFEAASATAEACRERLSGALADAAEAFGSHEKRSAIGEAIMDVLTELNFDVSYESGTREEPMRIAGQTLDSSGRGDFDIVIPLDGTVDFEVVTPDGDISCEGAVKALQRRLAERGIAWETTDWGYAEAVEELAPCSGNNSVARVTERVKVRRP